MSPSGRDDKGPSTPPKGGFPTPPRPEDFFGPESAPRPAAPAKAERDPYTQHMLRVGGIVGEFSAAILGAVLLGWLIDRWAGTSPRWTAILAGVGILGGGYNFIRRALALNRADSAGGKRGE